MKKTMVAFAMFLAVVAGMLASATAALADPSVVIYRPNGFDVYTCSYMNFGGTPSFGIVDADCYAKQSGVTAEPVFKYGFEKGGGGWDYRIKYNGVTTYGDNCYILQFSQDQVTLSCEA